MRWFFRKKKILTSVPWRLETSKSWKKPKKSQYSEFALNRSQKCPNVFWTYFEEIFSKKKFDQCSMEARDFKILKIVEKISKFQICPKSLPKLPNCVLNMFWGSFSKKNFAQCSMEGRDFKKFQKKFKKCENSKNVQNRSQKFPKVFWGDFFENFLCPVLHGGSSTRKFSKWNIFKIPKKPKIVTKSVQTYFEHVLGKFVQKKFYPVFHGGSRFQKISKEFKKCEKSKNAQNRSQK